MLSAASVEPESFFPACFPHVQGDGRGNLVFLDLCRLLFLIFGQAKLGVDCSGIISGVSFLDGPLMRSCGLIDPVALPMLRQRTSEGVRSA